MLCCALLFCILKNLRLQTMYSVIQFSEKDGGTVSVINNQWFTPRRCEVFWPPVKGTKAFERVLADDKTPDEKWKLYSVQRVFCETDDIEKAKKKLKLVEDTSDLQTEAEEEPSLKRKRFKRYVSSSDEENDNHIRPPPLKKKTFNKLETFQTAGGTRQAQPNIIQETPSVPEKTISFWNLVDGLPVLTNSVLQDIAEDVEGRQTPVAQLGSSRLRYEQSPNLGSDVPATPSSSFIQGLTGYQTKVLSLLSSLKTQNEQIINLLKHESTKGTLKPELKFPVKNADEVNGMEPLLAKKEIYDNLVSYMRTFGGRDISSKVYRIMKFCFTDQLAEQYNFYGKRSNKKPFCQLRLRECIVEAVVTTTPGSTAKEVEDFIKIWLKHAPERLKKSNRQK